MNKKNQGFNVISEMFTIGEEDSIDFPYNTLI